MLSIISGWDFLDLWNTALVKVVPVCYDVSLHPIIFKALHTDYIITNHKNVTSPCFHFLFDYSHTHKATYYPPLFSTKSQVLKYQ